MDTGTHREIHRKEALQYLVALIETRLNVRINPVKLGEFLDTYWDRLSMLAHTAHRHRDLMEMG